MPWSRCPCALLALGLAGALISLALLALLALTLRRLTGGLVALCLPLALLGLALLVVALRLLLRLPAGIRSWKCRITCASSVGLSSRVSSTTQNTGGNGAQEARAVAEKMPDAESKEAMLRIARDYERLAQQAEQRSGLAAKRAR